MVEIDIRRRAARISPLWFGHNLEHTRSCLWRGLSAQLLRNRKFAGAAGPDGLARGWHRVGPPGCLFMLERSAGRRGLAGESYTAHFDPDDHAGMQRQRVQGFGRAGPWGIGQDGVHLLGGVRYEGRIALLSDRPLAAGVSVRAHAGAGSWFEAEFRVRPGGWTEHRFDFAAPATAEGARVEITTAAAGALWIGAASLMRCDHFCGLRRDVVQLLKHIGVPILRWPGGNFAGAYRWKDGLLPVDRRAPVWAGGILPHTGGYDDHNIGTDEYLALCRELGAEPWITINMGMADPAAEAAAWVEYCNGSADTRWGALRAQRQGPQPFNVRYWSLGNEMGWPHMAGANEPGEYAAAAVQCAEAMRRAEPSVVLVASDGPEKQGWYTTVPRAAGCCFDHISYHEYTDLMKAYAGDGGRREFGRLAAAARDNLQTMKQIRAWVDANAPAGKPIGISFDEWNVWHAWYRRPGVAEGIHAAAMLSMFCREAPNVGMALGAYFQPVNEGAIVVTPDACALTAAGQVFAMFRAHHGNELLELGPAPGREGLDVVASLDEPAGEIVITLVNLNCEDEANAEIAFKGIGAIVSASGTVLASSDFAPESDFQAKPLPVAHGPGEILAVSMPPHSVGRLRVAWRQPSARTSTASMRPRSRKASTGCA